ncbi:MAG TPA: glycoside hydrolase family 2 TIM barrel-domain containing protein [Verrucomicrobiae bacterium]|jgi:hypothetical protein
MNYVLRPRPIAAAAILSLFALAASLSAEVPRPEHPRPDAFRPNWATLDGQWQFEIDGQNDGETRGLISGKNLASAITVPFCPESKLSGVGHYGFMKHTWYRRMFEVPPAMQGKRVLLHFGAVDYQARVWVNGQSAGSHSGGSVPFDFDVTPLLRAGENELVVNVFHDVASGKEPTGKQTHDVSQGCVYTRTTGIWQPVWLEAVGSSYLENYSIVTDPADSLVEIEAVVNKPEPGLALKAEAFANGQSVGADSCPAAVGKLHLTLHLSQKHLWAPSSPFLYDLKFSITRGPGTVDEMSSYFGLRNVSIAGRSILINGQRIFQRLILDQGFYPDGEWTAPSDAELKNDIERSMAAGFNGARLHQKVFEPRYLYWADKLGYLVWGEFPNWGFNYAREDYANYTNEWKEEVLRDRNHPAIIGWCPFNETPGAAGELQQIVWQQTKALDPTRPLIESSGWTHTIAQPLVLDDHDYNQDPAAFKQRWQDFFNHSAAEKIPARYNAAAKQADRGIPFMVSEFGGIGWATEGGWGYGNGPKTEEEFYARYGGLMAALLGNPNLFGFCYTQLTDVEQEHNGLYYYDRRPKFDLHRLHDFTARPAAYETSGPTAAITPPPNGHQWQVLVGAAADGEQAKPYRFTTTAPNTDWMKAGADDSLWDSGLAPFGHALPGVRTPWTSDDIWLRQPFEAGGERIQNAALVIFYDEDTEIYVNGQLIWRGSGYNTAYEGFDITETLRKACRKGRNLLAVHTHQTVGGQFIDLALLCEPATTKSARLSGH